MRLKILVTVFLLSIVSYSLFLYYMVGEVETRIDARVKLWAARQTSPELRVTYKDMKITGFPGRIKLTLRELKITTGNGRTDVVSLPSVTMAALPWSIYHIAITSDGGTIRLGDISRSGLTLTFGRTRASVLTDPASQRFRRISVISQALNWTSGHNGPASSAQNARLNLLWPSNARGQATTGMELPLLIKLYFAARDVTFRGLRGAAAGRKIDQAAINLQLRGKKLPAFSPDSLSRWRDSGGTLVVTGLTLKSGKISISLNGEVALDQQLKPLGAFSAKIDGITDIINILSAQTTPLPPTGKILLRQLRQMATSGNMPSRSGKKTADIAISLQNGMVFFGPVPIYKLTPVVKQTDYSSSP